MKIDRGLGAIAIASIAAGVIVFLARWPATADLGGGIAVAIIGPLALLILRGIRTADGQR